MVGVVKEQHIKYFLNPEQIEEVEDLMTGLHFQFNFGNVLPAQLVSNFVQRNNVDPTCPRGIVDSIK